jgi:hypothetical protein
LPFQVGFSFFATSHGGEDETKQRIEAVFSTEKTLKSLLTGFSPFATVHSLYLVSSPSGIENALVAQLAEHVLGKDEVTGSNPVEGSIGPR